MKKPGSGRWKTWRNRQEWPGAEQMAEVKGQFQVARLWRRTWRKAVEAALAGSGRYGQ